MNPVHCCCCLNTHGTLVEAITVIDGYAVCAEHAPAACGPFTDFAQLIARLKTTNPTETAT